MARLLRLPCQVSTADPIPTLCVNRADDADVVRVGVWVGAFKKTEWVSLTKEQAEALASMLHHWAQS